MKTKIIKVDDIEQIKVKRGFVVCGDIHLFNAYPFNDNTNVISSRLRDLSDAFIEVGYASRALNLPLIINGDLIMSGILDFPVEHVLTSMLSEFSDLTIYINLGNHDLDGKHSVITPLIKYGGNDNHYVISKPKLFRLDKQTDMFFIPFCSEPKTIAILNNQSLNSNKYNILFIHNSFSQALFSNDVESKAGINQQLFGKGRFNDYNLIVASHIHKYQEICMGKGFYTSSLIPLDFGERTKEHGFHIINLDKEIRYFVIPKAPKFLYIPISKLNTLDDEFLKKRVSGNIIRIINDNMNIELDKGLIHEKLINHGAKFVTFKKGYDKERQTEEIIPRHQEKAEAIVSSYSKIISRKSGLKITKIEKSGLKILAEARTQLAKESQKR